MKAHLIFGALAGFIALGAAYTLRAHQSEDFAVTCYADFEHAETESGLVYALRSIDAPETILFCVEE